MQVPRALANVLWRGLLCQVGRSVTGTTGRRQFDLSGQRGFYFWVTPLRLRVLFRAQDRGHPL